MLNKIKNRLAKELSCLISSLNRQYSLNKISPLLYKSIKDFVLRKGKRARPTLFIIGYLGFSKKPASGLYESALSLELLHDFMLVHDDIIDRSDTRRGKPSMHKLFNGYLKDEKKVKFNGQDLAIVAGDVIYAMGLNAFLCVKENPANKERAFRRLIEAVIYTGSGEFIELIYGMKGIDRITKENIYKIYDLKTANYTFASPLAIGSTLAGAPPAEVNKLFRYGICLGRAFQIKDDILGLFGNEAELGKSTLTDLQESKKTILIWHAYHNCDTKHKRIIKNILTKKNATRGNLLKICKIIKESGSLNYAERQIKKLSKKAAGIIKSSRMSARYKASLEKYSQDLLKI